MTTSEKVETAAWTLMAFVVIAGLLFGVVEFFYFIVWGWQ